MKLDCLHHVALRFKSVTQAALFYETLLGKKPNSTHLAPDGGLRSVWFQMGTMLLMIEQDLGEPDVLQGVLAFTIAKKDRTDWITHLNLLNIKIESQSSHSIYFKDLAGNRLALSHYPD